MVNDRDDIVQGNVVGRDKLPTRKQTKRWTIKVIHTAIGIASADLTYEHPPYEVGHCEEGDGFVCFGLFS